MRIMQNSNRRPTCYAAQLLTFLAVLSSHSHARPNLANKAFELLLQSRYHYLSERSCTNPCGWSQQLCCTADQTCGVDAAGKAVCNAGSSSSGSNDNSNTGWQYYTTTYVETDLLTRTSTYSSWYGAAASAVPAGGTGPSCNTGLLESPCGTICCASGQYCVYAGQCAASGNNDAESSSAYLGQIFTPAATTVSEPAPTDVTTPIYSAPLRPTGNALTTITSTGHTTITVGFKTSTTDLPLATAGAGNMGVVSTTTNNGLSGGAIAGIVIGVLLATVILILLLLCCCCKAGFDGLLAFFGLGRRRRREETTVIEERRRHDGHPTSRRWFGSGPARIDQPRRSGCGGLTALASFLGALGLLLGFRRKRRQEKSDSSSSTSYYSSYYSSDSSESSRSDDRYTRRSGRTGTTSRR